MLFDNIAINSAGHLSFAGYDTVELAKTYGTPVYLLDEERVRFRLRQYADTLSRRFKPGSGPLYASKALSFAGIYKIAAEEGAGIDVVSSGELYTALKAGFPPERMYFHGNNKTDEDIRFAIDSGVGCFVVDSLEELRAVGAYAAEKGKTQSILVRVTPGIDPHTFAAVNTGIDCQFGIPLENGMALEFTGRALKTAGVKLSGFHCHIGSQVFDWTPFRDAAELMLGFIADVKKKYGCEAEILNLGGGFGTRYVDSDPEVDIVANIEKLADFLPDRCREYGVREPVILMEPGRSIVADAGMTVYTVGSVKEINGGKVYVSVDGGMTDNPRYALYRAQYTVINADRAADECDLTCTIAGRCCETGAILQEDVKIATPARGEHIAFLVTGAYNYAMASNYNRVGRPPIVMLSPKGARVAVRRETLDDLIKCDVFD